MIELLTYISIIVTVIAVVIGVYQIWSDKIKSKKRNIEIEHYLKTKDALPLFNIPSRVNADEIMLQLMNRLIKGSLESLKYLEVPNENQICVDAIADNLYLRSGLTYFNISSSKDILESANKLIKCQTDIIDFKDLSISTFIFVTPFMWEMKDEWIQSQKKEEIWYDIKVYDAKVLTKWINQKPQVSIWLDIKYLGGYPTGGIQLTDDFWEEWSTGPKYSLNHKILLGGRKLEADKIYEGLKNPNILAVQDSSREEALAFIVAAFKNSLEYEQDYITRSFIIDNPDIFRQLSSVKTPLILIPRFDDLAVINRALTNGHNVLVPLSIDSSNNWSNKIILPLLDQKLFIDALSKSEIEKDLGDRFSDNSIEDIEEKRKEIAKNYSKESARNITILRRQLEFVRNIPEWAKPENVRLFIPALIVGRWDETFENDKSIIADLAHESYEDYSIKLNRLLYTSDSPLVKIGNTWRLASPLDAWTNASRYLTGNDFELLHTSFLKILGEINPAFELDADKRYMASIYGKNRQYSGWIREGIIQSLILTSIFGSRLNFNLPQSADRWVDFIIAEVLNNKSPLFWKSIESKLPLISEASPLEFLNSVEKLLIVENSPIKSLFVEEPGFMTAQSYHTGLLWALENIAWIPEYLSRSSLILAHLSAIDPGGSLSNRPINSLSEIFKPWHPQTFAKLNMRIDALKLIAAKEKNIAWILLTSMLPDPTGGTAHPTNKMRWRIFNVIPERSMKYEEIWDTHSAVIDILLSLFDNSEKKLSNLIEESVNLSCNDRNKVLTFVESKIKDVKQIDFIAWHTIRKILSHHRSYSDTDWALPESELKRYEILYQQLEPNNEIQKSIWLFDEYWPDFPEGFNYKDDSEQRRELQQNIIDEYRLSSLKKIYLEYGINKIKELSSEVKESWILGDTLARFLTDSESILSICEFLNNDKGSLRFVHSFIFRKTVLIGIDWSFSLYNELRNSGLSNKGLAQIFVPLNQSRVLWDFIDNTNEEIKEEYWHYVTPHFYYLSSEDKLTGLNYLLQYRRYFTAIDICSHSPENINSSILIEILEKAATEKASEDIHLRGYEVGRLFDTIEKREDIEKQKLINLEWLFLPVLASYGKQRSPKSLHDELSRNPDFFIEVLKLIYKPDNEKLIEKERKELTDEQIKNRAKQAYQLLNSWKNIPGVSDKNTIDIEFLNNWIAKVRDLAAKSDRLEVADMQIGQLLAQYPDNEENELNWPPDEICSIIEEINTDSLKDNFSTATFNKRSFSSRDPFEGGERERNLAKYFNKLAINKNKYPNVAAILSRLAKGYDQDAIKEDERAQRDRLEYA